MEKIINFDNAVITDVEVFIKKDGESFKKLDSKYYTVKGNKITMKREEEKKAVHSAIESGEIEKYSKEYFALNGKRGFEAQTKGKTAKQISEMMSNRAKKPRRKLSTGINK